MAEPYVTVHVSAELLAQLGDWSEPVQVQIVETPNLGTGWSMTARTVDLAAAEARGRAQAAGDIAELLDDRHGVIDGCGDIARAYAAEQDTQP